MVLRAGLEPARIAPHAPQTCAATNYATSARKDHLFAGALLAGGAAFDGAAGADGGADAGADALFVSFGITIVCCSLVFAMV